MAHRARNDLCDQCGQGGHIFLALAGPAVRRLGDSAPRWPAGSPAQWQTPGKWGCVGTRDRATKPSRGWLRVAYLKAHSKILTHKCPKTGARSKFIYSYAWGLGGGCEKRNLFQSRNFRFSWPTAKIVRAHAVKKTPVFCLQNAKIALNGAQLPRGLGKSRGFAVQNPAFCAKTAQTKILALTREN